MEKFKRMLKKATAMLMIAVLLIGIAPIGSLADVEWSEFVLRASAEEELAATGQCGENVYWNYDSLTGELVISGTETMYDYFYNDREINNSPFDKTNIKKIVINEGVTSIGNYTFEECMTLTSIEIPNSVTSIGKGVFRFCSNLTNIELPNGITNISEYTFTGCDSLINIKISESVTSIGDYAFSDCRSLTNIEIPNSVTSIGDSAFSDCRSLTNIEIPNSVTSIGNRAFSCCENLMCITVDEDNQYFESDKFGVLFNKDKTTLIQHPYGNGRSEYVIPNGVTNIGVSAFEKCKGLTNIEIPDSVTFVGNSAFYECTSLTNIKIPESVTSIDDYAFGDCKALTNIVVPGNVTTLGDYVFYNCSNLTDIEMCDGITSIGQGSFGFCKSLTTIEIPGSVTNIGDWAFEYCKNLINIEIPDSITTIHIGTFFCCTSLASIALPNSITSVGNNAFLDCTNLKDVYYTGSKEEWNNIFIDYANRELVNATVHYNSTISDTPEHNHSYNVTTTPATCTTSGIMTFTCSCGDTYTESIPATGHTEVTIPAIPATCTSTGLTEGKKCTVCGTITVKQNVVAKKPHSSDNGTVTKAATCTSAGTKTYKCTVCKTVVKTDTIPATGHKEIALNAVVATYTTEGKTAGKKCSVCGTVTVAQKAVAKLTLGKVSGLKAKTVKVAKSSEVTLSWNKIGDGVKYEVYQQNGKKWKKIKTTSKTSYTVKKLKSNKSYKFRVRAVVDDIKGKYSSTLTVKTVPATTSKLTLKAGKKQLTASWKSVSSISGYEVQYSTSKKFTKKTTKTVNVKKSAKKTTIKKLKKSKKYYVRLRTYKTVDGKKIYSSWSTVKNVKAK